MLSQAALRGLAASSSAPSSHYPPGVNFLRVPMLYTARQGLTEESQVAAEEIGTNSTYGTDPARFNDGDTSATMWNTSGQTMWVWIRTPADTDLSETRIAYQNTAQHAAGTVTVHRWDGIGWVFVSGLTYAGSGTLNVDTFATVRASLFRLTFLPGGSGWIGVNEIELYP
ncbi:hypothetical protein [Roseospira goensis]|uniref:F5/8 type C domain-containing protein n=1 Tax=Roseospira goensis TaxID=391922 RepID=A0A7W6WK74_9PROT|nr:hypothetical protein [Roseospira goensis]MBB4285122.1 hypothetical protein [Roseospira goensis]